MKQTLSNYSVWAEMARRKTQFHNNEAWDNIRLWGLFYRSDIKRLLSKGLLLEQGGDNSYAPRCLMWVAPSREAWEKYIKPLIEA